MIINEYFPKPKFLGGKVKVEIDLSNCTAKSYLKNATSVYRLIYQA